MNDTSKATCWVEMVLTKRAAGDVGTEPEELEIVRELGREYLARLDDPELREVALSDLEAIKEARPDLADRDVAHLVRTADDDEDAEAWLRRVLSFRAGRNV